MKNALILHGAGNNSQGNWFPWLKKELEKKGYKVFSPDLPNANNPRTKEWLKAIRGWNLDEQSVIIGHSSGGTIILRILEQLSPSIKINKAILIAAPLDKGSIPEYWPLKEHIAQGSFDWHKIKNSAKEFILIYSDNDPYDCGKRHGEEIQRQIDGRLIIKKGQGHFNLEVTGKDYHQFPELIDFVD